MSRRFGIVKGATRHSLAAVPAAPYERPAIVDRLEPGYGRLLDRAVEVLDADDRIRAIWLSGSLARGTADSVSDLDLLLAVDDGRFDEFAREWKEWLADITPTVIARALPFLPGSVYCVTPDRLRLDVVSERVSALANSMFRTRAAVLDKDGLDALIPPVLAGAGPSAERVAQLIEEFYRDYGMGRSRGTCSGSSTPRGICGWPWSRRAAARSARPSTPCSSPAIATTP